jgi:transposase-like protein
MHEKKTKQIKSTRANFQFNFSVSQILLIVEEVKKGVSRKEVCIKYGIAYATIGEWMRKYGQESKRVKVTDQQKREVVRAVTEGRMTIKEAQLATGVASKNSIGEWIRQARRESADLAAKNGISMPTVTIADHATDLAAARLKIAALETMIDIAEEQFKISIRKKSGAKQLPK